MLVHVAHGAIAAIRAGASGQAQTPDGEDHAWFTCFAPRSHPNIVITVLVEHGGFGARSALPVARELLVEADRLGYVRRAAEEQK